MTAPTPHCWLQASAGQGPDECALAVRLIVERILHEAAQHTIAAEIIDCVTGSRPGTYASALVRLQGNTLEAFVTRWCGTILWMSSSPYRQNCRRKNWFVGVEMVTAGTMGQGLKPQDVVFTTMRASGPGGQHVNVTESAVRATHRPTGITVVAREERSQQLNKRLAMGRLQDRLEQSRLAAQDNAKRQLWHEHNRVQRGNPVRTFVGETFEER